MVSSLDDVRERFQALHEIVAAARARLDRNAWDYIVGGTETETTVRRNRQALDSLALRHRVLNDVSRVDPSGLLLGRRLRLPVMLAPVGTLTRFSPDGVAAVAEAAGEFGCGMLQSSVTEPPLEETARRAPGTFKIFQLYVRGDSGWIDAILQRAVDAGFNALCLTVDSAHYSRRERDIAKRFRAASARSTEGIQLQAGLDWAEVKRVRARFAQPLVLKGIGTAEDARIALDHGVNVIYVSNHGGRQLDHELGTMQVLPEIVDAVGAKAEIVIDGGFCRGTDIVKAIALGANAVGMGRLYCYGLAAAGRAGVVRVLELLEDEVTKALALIGVESFAKLNPSFVRQVAPVVPAHVLSAFPLIPPVDDRY